MDGAARMLRERRYFTASSVLIALLVLVGFSRTFYLHTLFNVAMPSRFIAFHGALMTGWIVLVLVQALLIRQGKTNWHRWLGFAGLAYAAVIVPVGFLATFGAAIREVRAHSAFVPSQLNVLGLEQMQMLLFGGLVAAAALLRSRTDYHKRLMLIATLCIVPNAIVRLSFMIESDYLRTNLQFVTVWTALVAAFVGADVLRTRRLHPAFAWGASIAVASLYTAWYISRTAAWDQYWISVLG